MVGSEYHGFVAFLRVLIWDDRVRELRQVKVVR